MREEQEGEEIGHFDPLVTLRTPVLQSITFRAGAGMYFLFQLAKEDRRGFYPPVRKYPGIETLRA